VIRKAGVAVLGLLTALVAGIGCQPPPSGISQIEPYTGSRPPPVSPLRERPKAAKPPAGRDSGEKAWIPPGGISDRWQYIVVHHSGSDKSTPEGMRSWHMNGRGWDELGYHFVVGNGIGYGDGAVYVGQRWTKQMHGAHCKTPDNYYNEHGIGICLIGDLNGHPPTPKQVRSLARLAAFLSQKCGIPRSKVLTHRGVTHKTECPGRLFSLATVLQQMSQPAVAASSK
jgi:hypothetical protein